MPKRSTTCLLLSGLVLLAAGCGTTPTTDMPPARGPAVTVTSPAAQTHPASATTNVATPPNDTAATTTTAAPAATVASTTTEASTTAEAPTTTVPAATTTSTTVTLPVTTAAETTTTTGAAATPAIDGPAAVAGPGFDPGTLYVALYGHPGSATLGVLGETDVTAAVERAHSVAEPYAAFGRPVVATFEIITTVASSAAGDDGDYSNEFPVSKFQPWIDAATAAGMHVVLDLQSGRSTFPAQAAEIEGLLAHPHVSLAIDPEWRVGPDEQPGGGRIGSVDAGEVNETVDFLDALIRRHGLLPKMLIVHAFTPAMVTNRAAIRGTDVVQVVFQMDGFGSLTAKRGSWDRMIGDLPAGAITGWKNFYDEDQPTPTPAETLNNAPTPLYVSYQ